LTIDRTNDLVSILASLAPSPVRGTVFYRSVQADRIGSILSTLWSSKTGGRYNLKGAFEALYLADSPSTALFEVDAMRANSAGTIHGTRFPPRVLVSVDVTLDRCVRLTDEAVRTSLAVIEDDLYLPWRVEQVSGPTLTQQLGAAARIATLEAVMVPSAKARGEPTSLSFRISYALAVR
jgi:RES domain-containing protein